MNINDGGYAFPSPASPRDGWEAVLGMTVREHFAGQAMHGLLSGQYRDTGRYNFSEVAEEAVKIADALLAALAAR